MKTSLLFKNISLKFNEELSKRTFNRDHIFFNVLQLLKSKVNSVQQVQVIYIFSEIEKALSMIRKNDLSCDTQIEKIDNIYLNLDDNLKNHLGISYYPMKALQFYHKNEFEKAIESLNNFFKLSDLILKEDLVLKNLANSEQKLNLFRVYSNQKNNKDSFHEAKKLLLFCNFGLIEDGDRLIFSNIDSLKKENNEFNLWRKYHTESIFRRFINNNINFELLKQYINMFNIIEIENFDDYFSNSIKSLYYYFNNDLKNQILYFEKSFDYFDEYSVSLLYINLVAVNDTLCKDNKEIFISIVNNFLSTKIINNNNLQYIKLLNA